MGDILFDWCVTKEADSNVWSAKKGTTTITAGSLESLREAIIVEITRDDPDEHLLRVMRAIKTLAERGGIRPDEPTDQDVEAVRAGASLPLYAGDAYERLSLAMADAHAYLMRHHYPID